MNNNKNLLKLLIYKERHFKPEHPWKDHSVYYEEDWLFIKYTYFDMHGAEQTDDQCSPISNTINASEEENIKNWPKNFFQACDRLLTKILIVDKESKNWSKKDVQIILNKESRISPCTLAYNWQSNLVETLTREERRAFHLAFAKLIIER